MKKCFVLFLSLLITVAVYAQSENDSAYNAGRIAGKIVGIAVFVGFFVWGVVQLINKSNNRTSGR